MVRLRFETDLSTSLKATADLAAAYEKLGKTVAGSTKEMRQLEAQAKRLVDANLTPQEKYNRSLETMAQAVKAGKLSMEQAETTAGRLRERLEGVRQTGLRAFGASAISDLKSYALGFASVTGAIALARGELEAFRARQEAITQAQLGAAPARDILKRNIGVLGPVAGRQFEARAEALAGELGLPQPIIDQALAQAFSASGGNVEQAFQRARIAGQFLKTAPEQVGPFAGSLGDIAKATRDPNALRNLGFLLTVGAFSRVVDAQKQAATIPAALAGAKTFGATAEQGGALFAALSVAAAEAEGDVTKTAVISSVESLRAFFDAQVKKRRFRPEQVDTFAERLAILHGDPRLARQFADVGDFGRAQAKGPLTEFFTDPESEIARLYRENLAGFGTPQEQIRRAQETIGYLGEGRLARTAAVERTIAATTEKLRLRSDAELTEQSRRDVFELRRKLTGQTYYGNLLTAFLRTWTSLGPEEGAGLLEETLSSLQSTAPAKYGRLDPALLRDTKQMIEELRRINGSVAPGPAGRQE